MRIWDSELLARKAQSYVTDGLVLWLDGIRNTRAGHDPQATAWEDISGNGFDFPAANGSPVWGNDHCAFNGQFYFSRQNPNNDFANTKTVEFCYLSANQVCIFVFRNGACAYDWQSKLWVGDDSLNSVSHCDAFQKESDLMCVSYVKSNAPNVCTINGTARSKTAHDFWSESGRVAVIGCRTDGGAGYRKAFKLYALRMYNRILTQDEITQNYLADVARFGIGG